MTRYWLTSMLFALLVMFSFSEAHSAEILLDGDTPETGSNLKTEPLVTPYGTITFTGGWVVNEFYHDLAFMTSPYAELAFDFDVDSISLIAYSLQGGIYAAALDINDVVVDSYHTEDYILGLQVNLSGTGIRSFRFVDGRLIGGWASVDDVVLTTSAEPTFAALIDNGDGTITDTNTNLMWLKDANYFNQWHSNDNASDAEWWANELIFAGHDDWRLPTAYNQDGSGPCRGYNCSDSELGHLFYISLGNKSILEPDGGLVHSAPFINIQTNTGYWTNTYYWGSDCATPCVWLFSFGNGIQLPVFEGTSGESAWAVRDMLTEEIDDDEDGYTENQGDCNDTDPEVNPGVTEVPYNGKDDDCNAVTLDDDLDEDGYPLATDCDDADSSVNPGVTEVPYNGKDDDCSSATLDDDLDEDGYILATDCDDTDPAINPGIAEICNGIDDNCVNGIDEDFNVGEACISLSNSCGDYNTGSFVCTVDHSSTECDAVQPDERNGYGESCVSPANNCGDTNSGVNICAEFGVECNAVTPNDRPLVTAYTDSDGDGYGDINNPVDATCGIPSGAVDNSLDCDDTDPNINPGVTEIKHDGIDQDCNDYDLTIDIILADYNVHNNTLKVDATSDLGQNADLELTGFSPMTWYANKSKWMITLIDAGEIPAIVTVCGIEGCDSVPLTGCYDSTRVVGDSTEYYTSIQSAYDLASEGDAVQIQEGTHVEDLNINSNKTLTFASGYGCIYTSITGITKINGNVTVSDGQVSVINGKVIVGE